MKEHIDKVLETIEEDYKACLRIIGKYFDYLEKCGLKDFNKFSKYKWTYDRDKTNGYSYICIRYRSSLMKKILIKKRAHIEDDELYKWVRNKDLVEEALSEAYEYIEKTLENVKVKIEEIKSVAEEYDKKLEGLQEDDGDEFLVYKTFKKA